MKMRDIMRIVEGETDTYQGAPLHARTNSGLPFDANEVLRYLIQKIKASSAPMADIKTFAEERLYAAYSTVSGHFSGGNIRIYRMITAPRDWEPESDRLGIYWTWDWDYARAIWGREWDNGQNDEIKWLITATATSEDIDWFTTLVANAQPAFAEEREITLEERANGLTILSIEPCPSHHPNS